MRVTPVIKMVKVKSKSSEASVALLLSLSHDLSLLYVDASIILMYVTFRVPYVWIVFDI